MRNQTDIPKFTGWRTAGRTASTFLVSMLALSACSGPIGFLNPSTTPTQEPSLTATPTLTPSLTASVTPIPSPSATPTVTSTPTETLTPTITNTPTITPTPTFDFPDGVISEPQAFCRYGPGRAYLHAYSFVEGDHVVIRGRTSSGTWLYVQPDDVNYHCWAAASVMEVTGDLRTVRVQQVILPRTTFAGPPSNVQAVRNGEEVTVSWDRVPLSEDKNRGYLLEVTVCQNGGPVWMAVQTDELAYTFTDAPECGGSGGLLYTAEKHGYSDPVTIPWP